MLVCNIDLSTWKRSKVVPQKQPHFCLFSITYTKVGFLVFRLVLRCSIASFDALYLFDCQVLDAPALQDDFYLNLVDWSSHNVLSVGLGTCVYLWSACTSKVLFNSLISLMSVLLA